MLQTMLIHYFGADGSRFKLLMVKLVLISAAVYIANVKSVLDFELLKN